MSQLTWRQWMERYLTERGLWEREAKAVVDGCLAEDAASKSPGISDIADKGHEGYPLAMDAVAALILSHKAIEWIDANKPLHWARPMFLPRAEREKLFASLEADCDK